MRNDDLDGGLTFVDGAAGGGSHLWEDGGKEGIEPMVFLVACHVSVCLCVYVYGLCEWLWPLVTERV